MNFTRNGLIDLTDLRRFYWPGFLTSRSRHFTVKVTPTHTTLVGFIFPHRPHPSGIGRGVVFFIRSSYRPHKIESPFYQSFENMVVSIGLHGRSLLLACIYCPPGSCTCNFHVICWFPVIY